MKIIFLDVDGVLNHSQCEGWNTDIAPYVLAPECLDQLHRILLLTNARIVLSSTWRLYPEACAILDKEISISEPTILGKTPVLGWGSKFPRSDEILKWLEAVWPLVFGWNGEKITHMAVIDDDLDADLHDGSFFRTIFESGGLTQEIADRVIIHLGGTP